MKANEIILGMVATIAVALCSCSSYEDPDDMFSSKIDENFLLSISRGEINVKLSGSENHEYIRSYSAEEGQGVGKWEVSEYIGWRKGCVPYNFFIYNGSGWNVIDLYVSWGPLPTMLGDIWQLYCKYANYTKSYTNFLYRLPLVYDSKTKTITVGGHELKVVGASKEYITCSQVSLGYGSTEITEFKSITKYNVYSLDSAGMESRDFFESENEIKLYMVRLMREYFGDIIDESYSDDMIYYKDTVFDLAKYEKYLLGESNESTGWYYYVGEM